MSLSYDGSLLNHLAKHMIFLSATPSFWYSLNFSYDHGFHLSHCLGMTPHDYKCLLAAANLAHYHPKLGFTILVLCTSLLLHCLSLSSRCALLSSSRRAGWLLRPHLTRHPLVISLSHPAALLSSCCASLLSLRYHAVEVIC